MDKDKTIKRLTHFNKSHANDFTLKLQFIGAFVIRYQHIEDVTILNTFACSFWDNVFFK